MPDGTSTIRCTPYRQPDGRWVIDIDDETMAELVRRASIEQGSTEDVIRNALDDLELPWIQCERPTEALDRLSTADEIVVMYIGRESRARFRHDEMADAWAVRRERDR